MVDKIKRKPFHFKSLISKFINFCFDKICQTTTTSMDDNCHKCHKWSFLVG